MLLKFQWSAVKQTKWHECLIRFVLGGGITLVAGLLAKHFGPAFGGLFLAFPAIFPASSTLVEQHERQRKEKVGLSGSRRGKEAAALDALGAVLGSIALMCFAIVAWKELARFNSLAAICGAMLVWLGVSIGLWRWRQAH